MTRAFIFPGQGSQAVGMGKALADTFAAAREVFQEVDDALNQKLSKLMWEGPESDLVLTENAQPAIMAASYAIIRILEREAGFSLWRNMRASSPVTRSANTPRCARRARSRLQTRRVCSKRAARRCRPPCRSGRAAMSALLGAEIEQAEEARQGSCAAATGGVCVVANDNAPGQVVISGTKAAIDKAPAKSPRRRASSAPWR